MSATEQNLDFKTMSTEKFISILKWALIGPIFAWALFLGFDVGFPKNQNELFFSLNMTAVSYVFAMIVVSLFLYSKNDRLIDKLLGDKSSVDDATFNLLHAVDFTIEPTKEFKPKYQVELSVQILQAEIEKAKEVGASNAMIAKYLRRELDHWMERKIRAESDFEAYTQIIDELNK